MDIVCQLCKEENKVKVFKSYKGLSSHLAQFHNIKNTKEYYTTYISNNHLCELCGEELRYISLGFGFAECGSNSCISNRIKQTKLKNHAIGADVQHEP